MRQAFIAYESIKAAQSDEAEQTARMVWAVAAGWKRPLELSEAMPELKKSGMMVEI